MKESNLKKKSKWGKKMIVDGYFNSREDDRLYNADEIGMLFEGIISKDGVFKGYLNEFACIASEKNGIYYRISPGKCWFNRCWLLNDDFAYIQIENGDSTERIDAIVIDINKEDDSRVGTIKSIKGIGGKYPVLEFTNVHIQYPIVYIRVNPNATKISETSIISNRIGKEDISDNLGVMKGTPYAKIINNNCAIPTNKISISVGGIFMENHDVEKKYMQHNCFYTVSEKI